MFWCMDYTAHLSTKVLPACKRMETGTFSTQDSITRQVGPLKTALLKTTTSRPTLLFLCV